MPGGPTDLVQDLGGREVAAEAELAGRAERTADRTAYLARDADGVALAPAGPGRIVHEDGLDQVAVAEHVERLLGQPAVGGADLRRRERVDPERPVQLRSEIARQRPQLRHVASMPSPDRVGQLPGAVGRPAARGEPGPERLRAQAGQARSGRFRPGAGWIDGRRGSRTRDHEPVIVARALLTTAHATDIPASAGRPRSSSAPDIRLPPAGW